MNSTSLTRHLHKTTGPQASASLAALGATHILDFGPGGATGIGGSATFTAALVKGSGACVVLARGGGGAVPPWPSKDGDVMVGLAAVLREKPHVGEDWKESALVCLRSSSSHTPILPRH